MSRPATSDAPAIDLVSPLPPVRSGIADYAVDLAAPLAARCDLRLTRLAGQPVAPEVGRAWRPVPAERAGEDGRVPLYQMGNNRYHDGVLELALERPGVLVLHDLVLHHLLVDRTLGTGDFAAYRERLAGDHGWVGEAVAAPRRWGGESTASLFALPANRTLVRRQRAVLVHNAWAAERLLEVDADLRVGVVPMGVPLPEPPSPEGGTALRRRLGIPDGAPLIGCFGFQTAMKRLPVAIAALARRPLAEAHLLVAGEVAPDVDPTSEAARHGVAERLHVAGYLPFAELQAAIAACDVCLNLRYPTAGETSASLLRILACGRAAIVSDYGPLAHLPDEVALRVPLGREEVEAVADAGGELLADRPRRRAMEAAARRHVAAEHDPERAAAAVVDAVREWAAAEPPGDASPAPVVPTTLTWPTLGSRLAVEAPAAGWAPGERRELRLRLANQGHARWLPGEDPAGGIVLELELVDGTGRRLEAWPWRPLALTLPPGEAIELELEVRRPLGDGALRLAVTVRGRDASERHEVVAWRGAA